MPAGSGPTVPGVLHGIRVLDLASGIGGPYAAMFLADQGADVVKVEPETGDPYRADPGFQTLNRNKRAVIADDTAMAPLVAAADVVITDRAGHSAALRAANPTAVIVAMPPWGERGPLVDAPFSRQLLHAATGIAWGQQSYAEVPVDVVVPLASYAAGVLGALAAVSGLHVRRSREAVPTYEVSDVAGAAAIQLGDTTIGDSTEPRPGDSALGSKGRVGCYRLVEAGDGEWFFLACGTARFYERMLHVIGRPDLLDDPELANPPWGLMLDEAIAVITPILDEVFATRPRAEWLALLAAADVPAQPVLDRDAFLATSMVAANGLDVTVEHPDLGPVSMMGVPVNLEAAPGSVRRAAPLLGADDLSTIASEWAAAERAIVPPGTGDRSAELPLAGLTVLDLASFIAGPVISRHLAMLGADVIKIEPPTGDAFRGIGMPFLSWNQGKRSIALDLNSDEGRATFHRLAATADVVIENFRPGVAERLGADRATLHAINPSLITVSAPGYGHDASMAARPAFDPLVQALGGLMAAQGGTGSEPVFLSVPIHDLMTPLLGAFGVALAAHDRLATGTVHHVDTSLVASTMAAQAAEFTRFAGRPAPEEGGFDHAGPDPEHSWFERDGALFWRDGDQEVRIARHGITGTEIASANGLVVEASFADHGPLTTVGQLVGGAGPPPAPAPSLDEHGAEIASHAARTAPHTLPPPLSSSHPSPSPPPSTPGASS
ncbi:MAG: CoA transferase [Actinomycetota bacterium]